MYGWAERILRIELTRGKVFKQPLPNEWKKKFIGGRGINSYLLFNEVSPEIGAFDPENRLIFGVGPLTGTLAPASGRFTVTAKSPLTEILGDANCGGFWGPELKYAGYDQVVIEGRSKKPVYLLIDDDHVELREASHLWGRDTWETQDMIREELGDQKIKVACIGPAGENLVRFACIITGLKNAAGRTGMGAVMGSKKVKAIAVRGTQGVKIARPNEFQEICKKIHNVIREQPVYGTFTRFGTLFLMEMVIEQHELPVRNWQTIPPQESSQVTGEEFISKFAPRPRCCFGCPLHCNHFYVIREGPYAGSFGEGPEYEATAALGPRCGNFDYSSILELNNQCNKYGLDADSTGTLFSFLMELFQRRIITKKDAGGMEFLWGDYETMLKTIPMISNREGVGNLLAEGVFRVGQRIGKGAEKYALHIKKLCMPSCDLRGNKGYVLAYCTSTRGADHLRGLPTLSAQASGLKEFVEKTFRTTKVFDDSSFEGKAAATIWYEHLLAVTDCLELCKFVTIWQCFPLMFEEFARLLFAATGVSMSEKQIMKVGERIINLEKAFNLRHGITRKDDYPPRRFLEEPIIGGPKKGWFISREEYDRALSEYYELRGWNRKTGIPTRKKLAELELEDIAKNLKKNQIVRT